MIRHTSTRLTSILMLYLLLLCGIENVEAQRRKDIQIKPSQGSITASPSVETIKEIAQAMGAAEFESYTEGTRTIVKRLIPNKVDSDLDVISYQGVVGKAGIDFPAYPNIPNTGFNCRDVSTGYYADLETNCQVFHICDAHKKISFLCPNGTIFSQSHLICDWWFKVDCASSPALYEASAEQYSQEQHSKKQRNSQPSNGNNQYSMNQLNEAPSVHPKHNKGKYQHQEVAASTERHLKFTAPEQKAYRNLSTNSDQFDEKEGNGFDKKRKNLVQLIGNFASTKTQYRDTNVYRTTPVSEKINESQEASETASFVTKNNRNYLTNFNMPNYKYPQYSPVPTTRFNRVSATVPAFTTVFGNTNIVNRYTKSHLNTNNQFHSELSTKRPTLLPYTKFDNIKFTSEPYTRPGINLLKSYIQREKNKTESMLIKEESPVLRLKNIDSVTNSPISRSEHELYTSGSTPRGEFFSTSSLYNSQPTQPSYIQRRQKTGKKLNFDKIPEVLFDEMERQLKSRPGLIVPPSLTPKTLHSLAIYYANALDNVATTTEAIDEETDSPKDTVPTLLSRKTIDKYTTLFGPTSDGEELFKEIKFENNGTDNELGDDLSMDSSKPLTSSPQIRELAQVFTHALSAYLQDPVQFRKVLSDIRPTSPTFAEMITATASSMDEIGLRTRKNNDDEDEILGFSDDSKPLDRNHLAIRDGGSIVPCCQNDVSTSEYAETENPTTAETEFLTPTPFTIRVEDPKDLTTGRSPYVCCGSVSAAYTSASTENPEIDTTTPLAYEVNSLNTNTTDDYENNESTDSYSLPRYGGFQNNSLLNYSPYGKDVYSKINKPFGVEQYKETKNLPPRWGENKDFTTTQKVLNSRNNFYEENNRLKEETTTQPSTTQDYRNSVFTTQDDTESEEELQRAHSQSFVSPKDNIYSKVSKSNIRRPSKNIEIPTYNNKQFQYFTPTESTYFGTTKYLTDEITFSTVSTVQDGFGSNYYTGDKMIKDLSNPFFLSTNFDNWHSTVILDPITLNDGLGPTHEEIDAAALTNGQTLSWDHSPGTTPAGDYNKFNFVTNDLNQQSTQYFYPTSYPSTSEKPANILQTATTQNSRNHVNLDSTDRIATIDDAVIKKAKDIMGEFNVTTSASESLMNVMKKTKSKTVKRLILLLVQTCDDDHNKTAEASKKALLEALMAISQKELELNQGTETDAEELTTTTEPNRTSNTHRRSDKVISPFEFLDISQPFQRSGKSIKSASSNNNLNEKQTTTAISAATKQIKTSASRRGVRKFLVRTSPVEQAKSVTSDPPVAEASVLLSEDNKQKSDTRALELLRSLYSIAARWG